jgi:FG-GAP-like repeat
LRNNSFVRSGADISGGMAYDRQTVAADFDQDGKPDLAALSSYNGLMMYRNRSAGKAIQFDAPIYSGMTGFNRIEPADIDADGKIDIVLFGGQSGVARNVSSFEQLVFEYVPASINATAFLADMNADGKSDLVSVGGPSTIRVSFNTSMPGHISFLESKDYNCAFQLPFTYLVQAGDVDMDGAVDLFGVGGNYLHVLRNSGTALQPSFAQAASSYTFSGPSASYYYPEAVSLADLNNDGKPEVLIQHNTYSTASFGIHHNISTPGSVVLNPVQIIADAPTDRGIQLGDFNGDNKPDLLTGSGPWLYAYQNNSDGNSISLLPKISLQSSPDAACIADFDGDGKQDIATHSNEWIMLRNRMGEMQQQLICANGNVQLQANVSGASYQWQMDSGSGYTDVGNDANMNGTNAAVLSLLNVPTTWLQRSFRCKINGGTFFSEPYKIEFANTWVGNNGNSWHTSSNWSCGTVPDESTIVTVPSWKTIQVNANASCRFLWLESYGNVTVSPGVQFIITKQ